ncbi:hypothetical protein FD25_GL001805 [Levilactobacillus acidifarinae DSM 19394]|uniref:Gram-positive cocci surface proteins LPxTG domain-containing protein n=2 Tax=Levilactobacillus acidifarinae TaxID=267364 RepID=A0A0R1LKD0_9LACO|nr:hypothetical protein FD25_GL001805 [Levilactobacillus acidifarinae DSM 19394]
MVLAGTTAQADTTTTSTETTGQTTTTTTNLTQTQVSLKSAAVPDTTSTKQTSTTADPTTTEPVATEQNGTADTTVTEENDASGATTTKDQTPTEPTNSAPETPAESNQAESNPSAASEDSTSTDATESTPEKNQAPASDPSPTTETTTETPATETEDPVTDKVAAKAQSVQLLSAKAEVEKTSAAAITDDEDLSDRFDDPALLAAVRKTLKLNDGDAIYLDMIKNFNKIANVFSIEAYTQLSPSDRAYDPIYSLNGLEVLQNLPDSVLGVSLDVQLGQTAADLQAIDFSPLNGLRMRGINLYSSHWGAATDEQLQDLMQADISRTKNIEISSPDKYTPTLNGLNNRQFALLAPFVQAILENTVTDSQMLGFSGNNITDYSPLKGLTANNDSQVTGWFQYYQATNKVAYQLGDTIEITSPITGIHGESFKYDIRYYQNDNSGNLVTAAARAVTETVNGQTKTVWKYTLVNPKLYNGQLIYGQFSYGDAGRTTYRENSTGQPMSSFDLLAGALVYQPVGEATSTATVTYVDDTTGETLTSENLTGDVGATSDYRTATTIKGYTDLGYELVTDDYPVDGVTFTDAAQAFTIHLKHGVTALNNSKQVTQTIHYVYADGTTAAPDYTAWLTFTREGTRDQVTGEETWGEWQNIEGQDGFAAQTSPTLTGYIADQLEVPAVTGITAASDDVTTTVTYTAQDVQSVTVTYVDETTGATLKTETLTGLYGTTSEYRTAATIQAYLQQGYELVNDDYPATGVEFTDQAQAFTVRLKHGMTTLNNSKRVTQTIHYVYADGTTAAPDYTAWLTFTREGTRDQVTGTETWDEWQNIDGQGSFAAKTSPVLTGYIANQPEVAAIHDVTATSGDFTTTVTYTARDAQNVLVTYVDETTGQTLHTEALKGDAGTVSDYRTAATIQAYLQQGYELVSDDYPTTGAEFTTEVQTFTVRLKHRMTTISNSKRVTQTIHYVYADGTTAAPDYTAWLTFTRYGIRDEVTGVATWSEWQNIDGQGSFAAKTSPTIAGYTPDQATVAAINGVTATSADVTTTVTYTKKGAVVPVTPPVKPVKPVKPGKPDVDTGAQPDDGTAKPELVTGGNAAAGLTAAQKLRAQRLAAQANGAAANRGTGDAAAVTGTAADGTAPTARATQADTALPQTNEQTTPWAWLGALGLSLLGWVGLRRKKN